MKGLVKLLFASAWGAVILISSAIFIVGFVCLIFLHYPGLTDRLPGSAQLIILRIIIVGPPLLALGGFVLSLLGRLSSKSGACVFAFLCAFILAWWVYISVPVAHLSFSKDRYCTLEFHQWSTGRCVLSYDENGVCVGTVRLHSDLLNNPIAFFPGPDGESVVCLSDLDTMGVAFIVDFSKRDRNGVVIPERLRDPGEESVDRSDFEVRACTRKEVDFVAQYIKTTDPKTLSNLVRWGTTAPQTRENMLNFLKFATDIKPKLPPGIYN